MKKINFLAVLLGGFLSAQTTFTIVKDIYPGAVGSNPVNFTVYNGKLYFAASSTVNGTSIGNELWESDGTEAGTKLVSDIIPGQSSSSPSNLTVFNDKIYFTASNMVNGSSTAGLLLSYDATNGVKTISTTVKFGANLTTVGNKLYLKASNTAVTPNTNRLFSVDSNDQVTLTDDNLNVNVIGSIGSKVLANAQLATAPNPFLTQLFGFDGTSTDLIKNINPSTSSYPTNFYYSPALGKTFFNANGGNGAEPWMTDGTEAGTSIVKDINVSGPSAGSGPQNFMEYKGKVYFSASSGLEYGTELWVTDGTESGTMIVKDIVPDTPGSFPEKMVVYKDKLYFIITNGSIKQLWESDGTDAGTKILYTVSSVNALVVYNDNLYFAGRVSNSDVIGSELYKVNLDDANLAVSDVSNSGVKIYPNPSKGTFLINNVKKGTFEMYDFSGRKVEDGKITDGKVSTNVNSGNYILRIKSDDNKINETAKVIVQ
ncbi:ELWxxDGT repeat protein [Epilithonimonas mollis]|uniref:Por secretion system C-terminal sorting domain-containing protein n=1 Tax=Epilithonimonas mollis TaxID=216903 RepID=A0A1M6N0I9_9FLAO|nr:ELWxxDGT repeat protein [Epilithonimonas mollis]SHJ89257.1 Por secretion system C-terminal sorting domain-containing protein [Epilithonimonas mollis]